MNANTERERGKKDVIYSIKIRHRYCGEIPRNSNNHTAPDSRQKSAIIFTCSSTLFVAIQLDRKISYEIILLLVFFACFYPLYANYLHTYGHIMHGRNSCFSLCLNEIMKLNKTTVLLVFYFSFLSASFTLLFITQNSRRDHVLPLIPLSFVFVLTGFVVLRLNIPSENFLLLPSSTPLHTCV